MVVINDPTKKTPTTKTPRKEPDSEAEPVESGPYRDPPKVTELAKVRRYALAAKTLVSPSASRSNICWVPSHWV